MNHHSSLISTLSLVTGIVSYPLGIFSFMFFVLTCLCRIPDDRIILQILFFVMISITAVTAIVSIVLGVIGIKQKSENKRKAIIGVVLSCVMLVGAVCFYCFILQQPSNMNFIFYLL